MHDGERRERQVLDAVGEATAARRRTPAPCASDRPWNTFTSAPPVNTSPSARTISARGESDAAASSAARTASDQLAVEEVQRRVVDRDDRRGRRRARSARRRSSAQLRGHRRQLVRPRPRWGCPAGAAGRPRSAGSRGCGSGTPSARPPARSEFRRFTPSAPSRSRTRRRQPLGPPAPCAPGPRRRPRTGSGVVARDHQRVPAVHGLMSMNAIGVLVLVHPLRGAARPPRSCRRCSRPRARRDTLQRRRGHLLDETSFATGSSAWPRSSARRPRPGRREAAELIAAELRGAGARVRVEEERAHGTYWWPVGILTAAAGLAGAFRDGSPGWRGACSRRRP